MSAKRTSTIVVVALFLLAALATTANARPDPAAPGGPAMKATAGSHLASGHHAATGGASGPAPVVAKPLQNGSDGISTAAVAALMGLALLAGAMIAIWTAARTGYIRHERTASR